MSLYHSVILHATTCIIELGCFNITTLSWSGLKQASDNLLDNAETVIKIQEKQATQHKTYTHLSCKIHTYSYNH